MPNSSKRPTQRPSEGQSNGPKQPKKQRRTLEQRLEKRYPAFFKKLRASRRFAVWGEGLYYIGFWTEYGLLRTGRNLRSFGKKTAARCRNFFGGGLQKAVGILAHAVGEIFGPFRYFHQGMQSTMALVHWTFKSKGFAGAVKLLFRRLGMGAGRFNHLLHRSAFYIGPACALGLFALTVHTVINYNYILAVQVNDQIVGYVENELVFDEAKEAVQQRVDQANAFTQDADRKIDIVPTFTLAVGGETLDENSMADAILSAASNEIVEGSALYVDGDLAAITTQGSELRNDLESIKAPYEDADDPNQRVEFSRDVEVVDGVYFTDSVSDYEQIHEKIHGLEEAEVNYTVQNGDTPWSIAASQDLTLEELYAMNPEMQQSKYQMYPGDTLIVGQERQYLPVRVIYTQTYQVEVPFETITTESDEYDWGVTRTITTGSNGLKEVVAEVTYENGIEIDREILRETMLVDVVNAETVKGTRLKNGSVAATATGTIMWPVPNYRYVSRWMSSSHKGCDICAAYGTAILAADSGIVSAAGYNAAGGGYGYSIIINHGNGMTTLYAHCAKLLVSPGQYVSQGQVIGAVGSTGNSSGNHCHFEIRINGALTSARNYFPGM